MVFCNMDKKEFMAYYVRHNPYFNRWFSAIRIKEKDKMFLLSHNPYFNRWFSAIKLMDMYPCVTFESQSLF